MTLTPSEILDFWFEDDRCLHRDRWFKKSTDFDTRCTRFTAAIRAARSGALDHWALTPDGGLALIVLLDQLSRNVFRGTAEAFAADTHALRIARGMVDASFDKRLSPCERMFVYLPFEHAETIEDQNESVRLFGLLSSETDRDTLDYALRHREVIERFGRFPHRNAALGRSTTPEEAEYLAQPGAGF
jgi:uncharacterized protein (DUF924 family)